jgi:hypothetical protein
MFDRFNNNNNSQQERQQQRQQQPPKPSLKRKRVDQPLSSALLGDIPSQDKPVLPTNTELDPAGNVTPEDIPSPSSHYSKSNSTSKVQCVEVVTNGSRREVLPATTTDSPKADADVASPQTTPTTATTSTTWPVRSESSFDPRAWKKRRTTGPISNFSDRVLQVLHQWPVLEELSASMRHSLADMVPSMSADAQAFSAVSATASPTRTSISHVVNDQLQQQQQHNHHQDNSSAALERRQ